MVEKTYQFLSPTNEAKAMDSRTGNVGDLPADGSDLA